MLDLRKITEMTTCSSCTVVFCVLFLALFYIPLSVSTPIEDLGPNGQTTVKLLHMIFRHGDRTPIEAYPDDPYKNVSNWPVSWGQLTNEGKMRHFHLGQFVRNRYQSLLSTFYDPDEVYVRSTDVDRTLMSAESHLAGFFPPVGKQQWNPDLKWQPIPVHTMPKEEDLLLRVDSYCPRYDRLVKELGESPQIQEILAKNKDLFEYLTNNTGRKVSRIEDIEFLYDILFIEAKYNFTLPNWTRSVFPDKLKPLSDLSFALKAYTKEMQRLRGGPIVREMISHFNAVRNGSLEPAQRKLFIYSAHDVTVAVLLSALGVFNNIQPPYASLVMVELHQDPSSSYFVKVLYKNHTHHAVEPYVLVVPGCTKLCPLDKFIRLTKPVISNDLRSECEIPGAEPLTPEISGFALIGLICSAVLAFILLLTVVSGCLFWQRYKKTEGYTYLTVQTD